MANRDHEVEKEHNEYVVSFIIYGIPMSTRIFFRSSDAEYFKDKFCFQLLWSSDYCYALWDALLATFCSPGTLCGNLECNKQKMDLIRCILCDFYSEILSCTCVYALLVCIFFLIV